MRGLVASGKVLTLGVLVDLRKHWFVTALCIAAALIFTGALIFSSATYIRVVDAREVVVLADAHESAQVLSNGSLLVGLSVELRNPSHFELLLASVSWSVKLDISITGTAAYLPIASAYKGLTGSAVVAAGQTETFEYEAVISDREVLSKISNFLNVSASEGDDYTMETAPYIHDFRVSAWIDNFEHDYQYSGELYLNDMVRIERGYHEGEYA